MEEIFREISLLIGPFFGPTDDLILLPRDLPPLGLRRAENEKRVTPHAFPSPPPGRTPEDENGGKKKYGREIDTHTETHRAERACCGLLERKGVVEG